MLLTFEQPLNETLRVCLRLEQWLKEFHEQCTKETAYYHHAAVIALLRILNVTDRPDLKSKVTQMLSEQVTTLAQLEQFPQIDRDKLKQIIAGLDECIHTLHHLHGKLLEPLRQNNFLKQLRLHLNTPSGICYFNTPSYALWLNQVTAIRQQHLQEWNQDLDLLTRIITLTLQLTRDSAEFQHCKTEEGFYFQTLNPNLTCQLIRVQLPQALNIYPEISVGRHRLAIHLRQLNPQDLNEARAMQTINFNLSCCWV